MRASGSPAPNTHARTTRVPMPRAGWGGGGLPSRAMANAGRSARSPRRNEAVAATRPPASRVTPPATTWPGVDPNTIRTTTPTIAAATQ